jgi:hypothetical protein
MLSKLKKKTARFDLFIKRKGKNYKMNIRGELSMSEKSWFFSNGQPLFFQSVINFVSLLWFISSKTAEIVSVSGVSLVSNTASNTCVNLIFTGKFQTNGINHNIDYVVGIFRRQKNWVLLNSKVAPSSRYKKKIGFLC